MVDFTWISNELALGAKLTPEAAEWLARVHEFRRIVDMRAEQSDDPHVLRRHGIELLHLPTPDNQPVAQDKLWEGVAWVREGLAKKEKVLVHCEHGIGRSALLVCCVLVSLGETPITAIRRAKTMRRRVSPSASQLHAFLDWCTEWYRRQGITPPPVTWDDLAEVAYHS